VKAQQSDQRFLARAFVVNCHTAPAVDPAPFFPTTFQ